jgi:hypothetical protein
MNFNFKSIWLVFVVFLCSCGREIPTADRIITNANIWTGNPEKITVEAMAIAGDSILAVGSNQEILEYRSDKTIVHELDSGFIVPGFIDSHVHFFTGGFNLLSVKLRSAKSPEEFIEKIKAYAETIPEGSWILGGDWDHNNWDATLPHRTWIDSITPGHPVFVRRLDGHMGLANSLAMKLAGIDKNSENVDGGTIDRDSKGNLTGIFRDNAMNFILDSIPPPGEQEFQKALKAAMDYVASRGLTSVHHMAGISYPGEYEALKKARDNELLKTRIYFMHALPEWRALRDELERNGPGDNWLRIGGLKGFVDGSLGSHTAAFFEPYDDKPDDHGLFINSPDSINEQVKLADRAGLQIMIHAIGDSAVHFLLDVYERVAQENEKRDRRFRVEHAQHISSEDVPRFGKLNVIASMQPYHAIDDGR